VKPRDFTEEMLSYAATLRLVDALAGAPVAPELSGGPVHPAASAVQPIPPGLPHEGFLVSSHDVTVVDGDTLLVTLPDGMQVNDSSRVRVRLRASEAPELPMSGPADEILSGAGISRTGSHPGLLARAMLSNLVRHRELLIVPTGLDRYDRVLADTYAGPQHGSFSPDSCVSLDWELMRLGAVAQRAGEPMPNTRPALAEDPAPCPDLF